MSSHRNQAAHVRSAVAAGRGTGTQARMEQQGRGQAAHVRAAVAAGLGGGAQPKNALSTTTMASHVQSAIAANHPAGAQAKADNRQSRDGRSRQTASHVQAAMATPSHQEEPAKARHVQAAITAAARLGAAETSDKRPTQRALPQPSTPSAALQSRFEDATTQRLTEPSPSGAVIQCFTTIKLGGASFRLSENGKYAVGYDLSEIYVLPPNTVERSIKKHPAEFVEINKVDYEVWIPRRQVIGDCVACMEELMFDKPLKYGVPDLSKFRDVKSGSKSEFGASDSQNKKIGAKTDLDMDADPDVLEAFVIVRQKYKPKESRPQFHGAIVVAQDGEDDITLETTAPLSGDIEEAPVDPVYDIYSHGRGKRKQSFKIRYQAEYGNDASVSVLEKNPKKKLKPSEQSKWSRAKIESV